MWSMPMLLKAGPLIMNEVSGYVYQARLLVPKKLTFPSVLAKQCDVVPAMVDRWHYMAYL